MVGEEEEEEEEAASVRSLIRVNKEKGFRREKESEGKR